jgi:hypothetical protein
MNHHTTDVSDEIDTDRFETCPVSGRSFDATDPEQYRTVVVGSVGAEDGIKVAPDVTFTDVIDELLLVDGELGEPRPNEKRFEVTD